MNLLVNFEENLVLPLDKLKNKTINVNKLQLKLIILYTILFSMNTNLIWNVF